MLLLNEPTEGIQPNLVEEIEDVSSPSTKRRG